MAKIPKPVAFLLPILLLGPFVAEAGNVVGRDAIDIKVTPERLVLGESTEARVTVHVPTTYGRSCGALRIHANTGDITDVVKKREGEYTAAYRLPTDYFPRFALMAAATVCSGVKVSGIAVVELYGAGTVEVKSKPFSLVTLKIANDTFGPVLTNAKGKALVPIVVAPGIRTGVVGDKVIDLNLPAVNRIVAIADKVRVKAGEGENTSVIRIYAIDALGHPLAKAEFETRAQKGALSDVESLSPGLYRTAYTPPEQIVNGVDEISIGLEGDTVSVDTTAIELLPGSPARVRIDATPRQYTAGSGLPIEVAATVLDKFGNTTEADIVAKTDIGILTGPTPTAPGNLRMQLRLPDSFEGKRTAGITVSLEHNPRIKVETEVSLKAASPAAIEIEAVKGSVPADGITTHRIPATIRDRFGNPVGDLEPAVSATVGHTPPTAETNRDTYLIPFTPPLGKGPGVTQIRMSADHLTAETELTLSDRTYTLAFTPSAGFLTNFVHTHSPYVSADLDTNLWFLVRGLHALLEVGYAVSRAELDTEDYTSTLHGIPIVLSAAYRVYVSPKIFVSLAAGVGVHILRNRSRSQGGLDTIESGAALGARGVLTAGFRMGPGNILLRGGFLYAKPTRIQSISGNSGGMLWVLGYRYEFI